MRVFFDAEFTQFRDGELLALGFVTEEDHELVVEVHDAARYGRASDFCKSEVIPKFGAAEARVASTDAEAGEIVCLWLLKITGPLTLCYDYKLDWYFLESALRAANRLNSLVDRIYPLNIADIAKYDSCLQVQEDYFRTAGAPGRHHPLVDARALRARWNEYLRLEKQ